MTILRNSGFRAPLLPIALALWACASPTVTTDTGPRPPTCDVEMAPGGDGLRILFIGNSLTYSYDLPLLLGSLLELAEIPFARIDMSAEPNYGLEDHWASTITHTKLARGWDLVVMQQGPSATEGRPSLLEYADKFAERIRYYGGEPAMFMVWPAETRSFDFDGVSSSYATAAEQIDGHLFPVGEAWRSAWTRDASLGLYGPDRFHPSALGSYLAAITIFELIAGRVAPTPSGGICVPGHGLLNPLAELEALLRDAAAEANAEFARGPSGTPNAGERPR